MKISRQQNKYCCIRYCHDNPLSTDYHIIKRVGMVQLSICKTEYKVSYKPVVEATPMASILDQYEEESARATSISSVTPIQVPVSSNIFHSTHIEGTFTYIVFSIILKHINIQNFHILILDCQLNMTVQLIVIIFSKETRI